MLVERAKSPPTTECDSRETDDQAHWQHDHRDAKPEADDYQHEAGDNSDSMLEEPASSPKNRLGVRTCVMTFSLLPQMQDGRGKRHACLRAGFPGPPLAHDTHEALDA
jgi:hypothetical protein